MHLFRPLIGLALLATVAARLHGQVQLCIDHHGHPTPVVHVSGNQPFVQDPNGKLVEASGMRYSLQSVVEYAPAFVSLDRLRVIMHSVEVVDTGSEINNRFEFAADFKSRFELPDVFVALTMFSPEGGRMMFVQEIGPLHPFDPKSVDIFVPLSMGVGLPRYEVHVFTKGTEVLNSTLPPRSVEFELDRMVRRRIRDLKNAPVGLLVQPVPEYPAKLRRKKIRGQVVIKCTIDVNGRVLDPKVERASDPAFGASALESVRLTRFLPRVENGLPQFTTIELPYNFGSP